MIRYLLQQTFFFLLPLFVFLIFSYINYLRKGKKIKLDLQKTIKLFMLGIISLALSFLVLVSGREPTNRQYVPAFVNEQGKLIQGHYK